MDHIGSRHRRTSSVSHRIRLADKNVGLLDSLSSASLMEVTPKYFHSLTRTLNPFGPLDSFFSVLHTIFLTSG